MEQGGAFSFSGISAAAQSFLVAFLRDRFPQRAIVVVTAGVKAQEAFHQDVATWLKVRSERGEVRMEGGSHLSSHTSPLFFPAWDILPHEPKLPHVDVISERLETLVALG